MRYTPIIGSQGDEVASQSSQPQHYPCPPCGKRGKRTHVITRRIAHVAAGGRRAWSVADVGVDKARWACCTYFQAAIPGGPPRGRYALAVRTTVAHALSGDRMPSLSVLRRRQEDDRVALSLGSLHACFLWAHEQITMESQGEFVRTTFAGGLCLEEVQDSGLTMLCATAPRGDVPVSFKRVETTAQDPRDACLPALTDRGLDAQGILTDGAPRYTDALQRAGADVEPPLGVFPIIKGVNTLLLEGVRAINNHLKRQGHKGRKKRRGRPRKQAPQQRQRRSGQRKKEQARFLWAHQSLLVRNADALRDQDRAELALLLELAPALQLFRHCNQQFSRLCEKGIPQQCARARRPRLGNQAPYPANAFLAKALKKSSTDKFDKLLVFLGGQTASAPPSMSSATPGYCA